MSFVRNKPEFDPILVNHQTLESVNSVKSLGLNVSSDLKWNVHVSELKGLNNIIFSKMA